MKKKIIGKDMVYVLLGAGLLLVAIVVFIVILGQGETIINDGKITSIKMDSVSCVSDTADYPEILADNVLDKEIVFNLVFREDEIDKIGMLYTLTYGDSNAASRAKTFSEVNYSLATSNAGIGSVDSLSHKFSSNNDQIIFTLLAQNDDIVGAAAPYLLLEVDEDREIVPQTKEEYIANYEKFGFVCEKK